MSAEQIVLISDPAVLAVPVAECGEPLRDLRAQRQLRVGHSHADPAGAFALLRSGVLDRLEQAQAALPVGLHLLVVEGYRPPALQQAYFNEYADELRAANPAWSPSRIIAMASRYISPPSVAPHPAGAAVDLTLCDHDGGELDMGTAMGDNPEVSEGACYFAARSVTGLARANRDLLARVLSGAGLVNYPTEWWHWSYGDRYWAHLTGAPYALYDQIDSRTVGE